MAWFVFDSLSNMELQKSNTYLLVVVLVLILIDSKIDRGFRAMKDAFQFYSVKNKGEELIKRIPILSFWNKLEKSEGVRYIISNQLSQQYYAPVNYRLIQLQHHPEGNVLTQCDLNKLSKYSYAILSDQNISYNECYSKILSSPRLDKIGEYSLYQLPRP
ncbi:MAG: hypothetical protein OHK0056_17800 [Bacteriovoracaceae bacterium]